MVHMHAQSWDLGMALCKRGCNTIVCATAYTSFIRLVYTISVYFRCASLYTKCILVFSTCLSTWWYISVFPCYTHACIRSSNVIHLLYTWCCARNFNNNNYYRYAPPKTIQRMYVCVRVCMYVRTCTRIVERRALLVTFQRQRRVVRRFYSGDDSALGASTSTPQFIANYFQTRYLFSRPE